MTDNKRGIPAPFSLPARFKASLFLSLGFCMLLGDSAIASTVSVAQPFNIAGSATLSANDRTAGSGFGRGNAVNNVVSDGGLDFTDSGLHTLFADFGTINSGPFYSTSTNELVLQWTSAQTFTELVVYVQSGDNVGQASTFPDQTTRNVASVGFWVNTTTDTNNFTQVSGSPVTVTDLDSVGGFDRISISGNWSNIRQVGFSFTPSGSSGVRVGEVLAIAVPEPGTMGALGLVLGLATCVQRRRRAA